MLISLVTPSSRRCISEKPVPWGYTDFRIHTRCPGESLLVATGYWLCQFCHCLLLSCTQWDKSLVLLILPTKIGWRAESTLEGFEPGIFRSLCEDATDCATPSPALFQWLKKMIWSFCCVAGTIRNIICVE